MDVVRLVEEIKDVLDITMQNTDVFMAPSFSEFVAVVIITGRGSSGSGREANYETVEVRANNMDLRFPKQLFIDGEFVNGEAKPIPSIDPHDEHVICEVQSASPNDVDRAVQAAKKAFEEGEWSKISARDRGALLFK